MLINPKENKREDPSCISVNTTFGICAIVFNCIAYK